MTEKELRAKVASALDDYYGLTEGGTLHKKLISIFNSSGLCTRYTMTTSDAWCAMAVSCAFILSERTDIFPCVECSCSQMISKAKSAGIWVEEDSYVPGIGDVIMYDWDDTTGSSSDNTGTPDHTGIIKSITGTTITVVEGNYSDTVKERTMTVNGSYIRGYITPDYASASEADGCTEDWVKDSDGWRYRLADGSYVTNAWSLINGHWYLFGEDSYMLTGPQTDPKGDLYYLLEEGDYEGACCRTTSSGALVIWDVT